jgi:hypothetical protein
MAAGIGLAFSPTLTLSRWEREQPLTDYLKLECSQAEFRRGLVMKLGAFLPLRVGGVCGADGERPE